jgi:hypothetical protein
MQHKNVNIIDIFYTTSSRVSLFAQRRPLTGQG